ncbi:conserved hypothetical protein [Candidatus Desulfarcum epimagneticum]|uniref:Archease domain-containing protein n=1 Tax=uncultured Desulfobacteraceae bacterium TaxID=218296 RepID=A0A484HEM9_9BACT|nr:conserved hypothetical protein [uncultured Desulfobacteraceae bacterium]
MEKIPYELIDHTADMGMRVFAFDLAGLFQNAGMALFDQIADLSRVSPGEKTRLEVAGADLADLMFAWLGELLYLWSGKGRLADKIRVRSVSETKMEADVWTGVYDPARREIKHDIKAVTLHQLSVEKKNDVWTARVFFDV